MSVIYPSCPDTLFSCKQTKLQEPPQDRPVRIYSGPLDLSEKNGTYMHEVTIVPWESHVCMLPKTLAVL